jgi:hypothetical protein
VTGRVCEKAPKTLAHSNFWSKLLEWKKSHKTFGLLLSFEKIPKAKYRSKGENSPNLVTLVWTVPMRHLRPKELPNE